MRPLLKPLRYVLFRILRWKLKDSREATPFFAAGIIVALLVTLNAFVIVSVTQDIFGMTIISLTTLRALQALFPGSYLIAGLLMAALGTLIVNQWVPGHDMTALEDEFPQREARVERRWTIGFWAYVLGSTVGLIPLALIARLIFPRAH